MYKAYITIPKGTVYDTFVTEAALSEWKAFCEVDENPYNRQLTEEEICKRCRYYRVRLGHNTL